MKHERGVLSSFFMFSREYYFTFMKILLRSHYLAFSHLIYYRIDEELRIATQIRLKLNWGRDSLSHYFLVSTNCPNSSNFSIRICCLFSTANFFLNLIKNESFYSF